MQIMFIGIRSYMFQIMTRVTILMNLICPFTNPENKTKLLQNAAAGGELKCENESMKPN